MLTLLESEKNIRLQIFDDSQNLRNFCRYLTSTPTSHHKGWEPVWRGPMQTSHRLGSSFLLHVFLNQLEVQFFANVFLCQDTLDYSNHAFWPNLLYAVAFLHTVVQVLKQLCWSWSRTIVLIMKSNNCALTLWDIFRRGRSLVRLVGTCLMSSTGQTSLQAVRWVAFAI